MILIGLTGGIGMGKSTTAEMFAEEGIPVWDADGAVARLYAPGAAGAKAINDAFESVTTPEGGVDREKLSALLRADPEGFARLNALIHPLVAADREAFLEGANERGDPIVLCDIPLLLEGGTEEAFDVVVVVDAAEDVRRERVLARPGMSVEKYEMIVGQQMPADEKRARADFVIMTDQGKDHASAAVRAILNSLR